MSQRYLGGIITANPTTPTMTSESGVWTLEQQFQYNTTWSPKIVGNSVRFRNSIPGYFSRTPASATNRKTWTWSGWVKRGLLSSGYQTLFGSYDNASASDSSYFGLNFIPGDNLAVGLWSLNLRITTAVYRDPSAWYHVVCAVDTTQSTANNRVRLYINGSEVTSFSTTNNPSLNADLGINTTQPHNIGRQNYTSGSGPYPFDGYMAEIYFVDGQALTPSSFGAYDTTGTWQPLPYTGTYGTNGFYLTFADNSAATAAALGKDTSGNGNNWTPNNISLTAGATYDWMLDSPTNSDNGGTGRGNYAVFNPLAVTSVAATFADGNLKVTTGLAGGNGYGTFAIPSSGKWYWEITANSGNSPMIGVSDYLSTQTYAWQNTNSVFYYNTGQKYIDGTGTTYGATYTTNDVIGVAVDADAGTITFYKNNTSQGSISHAMAGLYPCLADGSSVTTDTFSANFGQRPFSYTPPTGFKALNTQNLPDPNITNGAQYMAATLYTGNGTSQSISNGANNPTGKTFYTDFLWQKARSSATDNIVYDTNRGSNYLVTNSTAADVSSGIIALTSTGFNAGSGSAVNSNGVTYVSWMWNAGSGTTASNTSGSITSTVSVNTKAGFSVVTFSTTAVTSQTFGHGLGVAPNMVIIKARNRVDDWYVYHSSIGNTGYLKLDTTDAVATSANLWNNTSPTSTIVTLGNGFNSVYNYVAYCWAAVAGYSAFGSYTGNGSSDGPFVYCGFRPRFVMVKISSGSTGSWWIWDSSRNTYNAASNLLAADTSGAEISPYNCDLLSNGFKLRDVTGALNGNTYTFIYAAFAENPFKISRAR